MNENTQNRKREGRGGKQEQEGQKTSQTDSQIEKNIVHLAVHFSDDTWRYKNRSENPKEQWRDRTVQKSNIIAKNEETENNTHERKKRKKTRERQHQEILSHPTHRKKTGKENRSSTIIHI